MNARSMLLGGALGTAAAGAAYEAFAERRDARRFPPPGSRVTVDGRGVHVVVRGPVSPTGPTVVLDAGLGSFSANWHWVQADLARDLRVVAYDRAGLGWSEPGPRPRDARTQAAELRSALRVARIPGPFVLAGHSYGWLPVRAFADLHPDETAGLVAVDGSHPDQWARWPTPRADRMLATSQRVTAVLARFGLLRVLDVSARVSAGLPPVQVAQMRAWLAAPRTSSVEADQVDAWPSAGAQIRAAGPLGDPPSGDPPLGNIPLAVLGVSEQPFGAETLSALQADLVTWSSNAVRRIVQGATHESLVSRPEHAAVVAAAIRAVVATGHGGRLAEHWAADTLVGGATGRP